MSVTPTPDGTPPRPERLPSTAACLTDAVPSPDVTAGTNGSVTGRPYPATPNSTTASPVADFAAAFEEAHFRNRILAEDGVSDAPVERVTAQVTRTNVTRFEGGYVVTVSGLGATTYENGVHGDYAISAVYRLTADSIERSGRVEAGERAFVPVVAC